MKYRRCYLCGSMVSEKYEAPKDLIYCPDCEKFKSESETYECETVKAVNPIVEGKTKHDTEFMGAYYCDEYCSHCNSEVYNIPTNRVSLCPECRQEIFPCSVCDDGCDWNNDTMGCHKFEHSDKHIKKNMKAGAI